VFVVVLSLIGGLAVGYATGGRLGNIEYARFRYAWLVGVALILQLTAFSPIGSPLGTGGVVALHLVSYAALLVFAAINLRSCGIAIASLGVLCNALAIATNGGYMPARQGALATAGKLYGGASDVNSRLIDGSTRFAFLGDLFAVPKGVPLANVFSVGDVLIAAGVALVIALAMHPHAKCRQAQRPA
jgi:Family of unknown function (DUF5317)